MLDLVSSDTRIRARHTLKIDPSRSMVTCLTAGEVAQLEKTVSHSQKAERDALLIRLLFQTGLRNSEALDQLDELEHESFGMGISVEPWVTSEEDPRTEPGVFF